MTIKVVIIDRAWDFQQSIEGWRTYNHAEEMGFIIHRSSRMNPTTLCEEWVQYWIEFDNDQDAVHFRLTYQ